MSNFYFTKDSFQFCHCVEIEIWSSDRLFHSNRLCENSLVTKTFFKCSSVSYNHNDQRLATCEYWLKIKVRNETRNGNQIRPQPEGRLRIDSLFIYTKLFQLKSKLFYLIIFSGPYYKYSNWTDCGSND